MEADVGSAGSIGASSKSATSFSEQRRRLGPSQRPCRTRHPQRCLPAGRVCPAQEAALILWPPRPDGDMRGLDSGGRWHQKDEAPSMKVKDITKSTLVCQQWRGRGRGLTFPGCPATQRILQLMIAGFPSGGKWVTAVEFISAGGNHSPTSKRPSRSTCRSALCF